jgi:hypothetical protein
MVQDKEATANRYINGFLLGSAGLLGAAFSRKVYVRNEESTHKH